MSKAKPFVATPLPDLTGKGWNDTISRAEFVTMIAPIVFPKLDSATRKKRVSSMVTSDVTNGILHCDKRGRILLGDASDWAMRKKRKWKFELLKVLPTRPRTATMVATMNPATLSASAHVGPTSFLEACSQINALIQENLTLTRALAACADQLSRDAPLAQKKRDENFAKTLLGRAQKNK